jgi:glutamine amidotransferase
MIVIVDYGVGNPTSIKNMLKKAGSESIISADAGEISAATKLIIPGVGAFDTGITNLTSAPYFEIFKIKIQNEKTPVLCICLGFQLLMDASEEGTLPGLGWVKGKVTKFRSANMQNGSLKVPHMGWSDVHFKKDSALIKDMPQDSRFYFVHSYHVECDDAADELISSAYGYPFTAGVQKDNIFGVQFHPEKSHKYGLKLFENFIQNC